jgi:hypothetical protein
MQWLTNKLDYYQIIILQHYHANLHKDHLINILKQCLILIDSGTLFYFLCALPCGSPVFVSVFIIFVCYYLLG